MKVSFSTARKLGIGMLLGIVMLGTAFSVHSLRHVTKQTTPNPAESEGKA